MTGHEVRWERRADNWARWCCSCGWATEWSMYTRPGSALAAVRHAAGGAR